MANATAPSSSRESIEINHLLKATYFPGVFSRFREMRFNMELCDITLKAGSLTFHAHRLILAGISPYFRNFFAAHTTTDEREPMLLKDFPADAVRSILEYFYSGKMSVRLGEIEGLLPLACFLQMDELVQELQDFVLYNLHSSNCLKYQRLARKLKLTNLKNKIDRFVDWNFKSLPREPDFLTMSAEHLLEVIKSDSLRVKREETVYEAVFRWFRYDVAGRERKAAEVFREVRYHQISPKYLAKEVVPNLCSKYNVCVEEVKDALENQSSLERTKSEFARKPQDSIYVISGRTNSVERYDPVKGACVPCPEMSPKGNDLTLMENRCALVVGKELFIVSSSKVKKFDLVTLCWTEIAEGVDVHDSGVCHGKDCFFVVGGRQRSKGVCKFDLEACEWNELPDMDTSRRCPGVAFLSGKLYVIGGHSPDGPLASVERFDTKQVKWVTLKPMNTRRFQLEACALNGLVYAVGGRNNERSLKTMEVYDPKAKLWTVMDEPMRESRNDFGLVSRSNEICCIGGRGVNSIECYDIEKKEWKTIGSTNEHNFCISCVFYPPF